MVNAKNKVDTFLKEMERGVWVVWLPDKNDRRIVREEDAGEQIIFKHSSRPCIEKLVKTKDGIVEVIFGTPGLKNELEERILLHPSDGFEVTLDETGVLVLTYTKKPTILIAAIKEAVVVGETTKSFKEFGGTWTYPVLEVPKSFREKILSSGYVIAEEVERYNNIEAAERMLQITSFFNIKSL
ncbi:MAG: hypothetical protein WAO24_05510 [Peptococcia bacterium]